MQIYSNEIIQVCRKENVDAAPKNRAKALQGLCLQASNRH